MIENIRNQFIDIINQSTWMDSVSKRKAIEKVSEIYIDLNLGKTNIIVQARAMNSKVGYPEYLDDNHTTKLEKHYAEVENNPQRFF